MLHTSMEPNAGLELTTLRSRPEPRSRVRHLTDWAMQVPCPYFLIVLATSYLIIKINYIVKTFKKPLLTFSFLRLGSVIPVFAHTRFGLYLCHCLPALYWHHVMDYSCSTDCMFIVNRNYSMHLSYLVKFYVCSTCLISWLELDR